MACQDCHTSLNTEKVESRELANCSHMKFCLSCAQRCENIIIRQAIHSAISSSHASGASSEPWDIHRNKLLQMFLDDSSHRLFKCPFEDCSEPLTLDAFERLSVVKSPQTLQQLINESKCYLFLEKSPELDCSCCGTTVFEAPSSDPRSTVPTPTLYLCGHVFCPECSLNLVDATVAAIMGSLRPGMNATHHAAVHTHSLFPCLFGCTTRTPAHNLPKFLFNAVQTAVLHSCDARKAVAEADQSSSEDQAVRVRSCPQCGYPCEKISQYHSSSAATIGLQAGTNQCHHVKCGGCRADLCFVCMQLASNCQGRCPRYDLPVSTFRYGNNWLVRLHRSCDGFDARCKSLCTRNADHPDGTLLIFKPLTESDNPRNVRFLEDYAGDPLVPTDSHWCVDVRNGLVVSIRGTSGFFPFYQDVPREFAALEVDDQGKVQVLYKHDTSEWAAEVPHVMARSSVPLPWPPEERDNQLHSYVRQRDERLRQDRLGTRQVHMHSAQAQASSAGGQAAWSPVLGRAAAKALLATEREDAARAAALAAALASRQKVVGSWWRDAPPDPTKPAAQSSLHKTATSPAPARSASSNWRDPSPRAHVTGGACEPQAAPRAAWGTARTIHTAKEPSGLGPAPAPAPASSSSAQSTPSTSTPAVIPTAPLSYRAAASRSPAKPAEHRRTTAAHGPAQGSRLGPAPISTSTTSPVLRPTTSCSSAFASLDRKREGRKEGRASRETLAGPLASAALALEPAQSTASSPVPAPSATAPAPAARVVKRDGKVVAIEVPDLEMDLFVEGLLRAKNGVQRPSAPRIPHNAVSVD